MRKIAVAVLFASLAACRSEVPSPTQETAPPVASQQPAVVDVPSQQPAAPPKSDVLVVYSSYAGYAVTNLSGKPQQYRAYITSFDDQSHELAFAVSGDVQQAHEWAGTFNRACVQLDLTQAGVAGTPFAYTYFDINGKEFTPSRTPEKVRECQPRPQPTPTPQPQCDGDCEPTPQPTPTPTPSPSPTPTPPAICHVSNKGKKDGNFDLVVTWKRGGEGHELHLDSTKFCPPDFYASSALASTNTQHGDECKVEGPNAELCSCEVALAKARACREPRED